MKLFPQEKGIIDCNRFSIPYRVYGKKDAIINYDDAKELADKLPKGEIITVEDTGHFLHLENELVFEIYARILALTRPG